MQSYISRVKILKNQQYFQKSYTLTEQNFRISKNTLQTLTDTGLTANFQNLQF